MDLDEILIEEVRNRPFLYDLGHEDYKNLRGKKYAWKEIAVETKLSEHECKKRWKSLRDSYKRCKRMKQVACDSNDETPRQKWKYFKAMSFMDNVSNSRRTISSYNSDVTDVTDVKYTEKSEEIDKLDVDSFSESWRSKSPDPRRKNKRDSVKFQKFLDLADASISETCAAFVSQTGRQNSTALHFSSLAAKLVESDLPPNIVNDIEAKVSALVFSEIKKYYSNIIE